MKYWSQFFIPTLKESPADAEIASHKLLVRAGIVRKLTGGHYTYMPFGLRAIHKITQICREEIDISRPKSTYADVAPTTTQSPDFSRRSR